MTRTTVQAPRGARALFDRPFHDWSRSDIALARRAIREGWPIDSGDRRRLVAILTVIATHPGRCGARASVAAARALLDADEINMEGEARRGKPRTGPEALKNPSP